MTIASDRSITLQRMKAVQEDVEEFIRSRPAMDTSCVYLYRWTPSDLVGFGLGWSYTALSEVRQKSLLTQCDLVVGDKVARAWKDTDFPPFWHSIPAAQFAERWLKARECAPHWMSGVPYKCEGNAVSVKYRTPLPKDKDLFLDLELQEFVPRLSSYQPLFEDPYVGIHIRHGDKLAEVGSNNIYSLPDVMEAIKSRWPQMRNVFVATDDKNELTDSRLDTFRAEGYTFRWTVGEQRWTGGTPMKQLGEHDERHMNDDEAVDAALADISGLAYASVMVVALHSNFAKLSWRLNLHMHASEQRAAWCYDMYRHCVCDVWGFSMDKSCVATPPGSASTAS